LPTLDLKKDGSLLISVWENSLFRELISIFWNISKKKFRAINEILDFLKNWVSFFSAGSLFW